MRLVFYTVFSLLALGLVVGIFTNTAQASEIYTQTLNEKDLYSNIYGTQSNRDHVVHISDPNISEYTITNTDTASFDFWYGITATSSDIISSSNTRIGVVIGRFDSPFNNAEFNMPLTSDEIAEINANKGTSIRIRRENVANTGTFNLVSPFNCTVAGNNCGFIVTVKSIVSSGTAQAFTLANSSDQIFGTLLINESLPPIPPDDTSTRIVNALPVLPGETSTTTPTTSVTFAMGGYVNSLTPAQLPDRLLLRATRVDQAGGFFEEWEIPYDQFFATSTTLTLATSSQWRYYWQFLTPSDTVYLQSDTFTVNVVSNPLPGLVGVGDLGDLTGLATSTCSIGNIAGCFQNALIFAFYPNEEFLRGMFDSLRGLVAQKPPFGYINNTIAEMEDIEEGEAPFSIAFLYAFSGVFTPLRNGLGAVLWFLALVYFYNRMKHIEP